MFIAELATRTSTRYDLSSLRTGLMSGSPCPVEVMHQVPRDGDRRDLDRLRDDRNLTGDDDVRVDDTLEHRCATVGQVMPYTEIKIVDPHTGHIQPRGVPGEFQARGYAVMRGYWNEPERTAGAIDQALGCIPVTWRRWMTTVTCGSSGGSGTS